ncbi:MAG TPA: hypothetical protein PKN32_09795, partial [Bacteroidales bacterium]|nr:hypothetical protein [Bacteroidales bacterium]
MRSIIRNRLVFFIESLNNIKYILFVSFILFLIFFGLGSYGANSTFGSMSLTLSNNTGCTISTYTFTQTVGNSADYQINIGHSVTITFPSGTDASTFTGGTFKGIAISGATVTATQISFSAPAQVKKSIEFSIVLNGITNGESISGNCTVVTANASLGTNTGTYAFITTSCACAPITSLPWSENFDAVSTPSLPNCWTIEDNSAPSDD